MIDDRGSPAAQGATGARWNRGRPEPERFPPAAGIGMAGDRLLLSRPPDLPLGYDPGRVIAEKVGVAAFSVGMVGATVAGIGAVVFGAPLWIPLAFVALAGAGALSIAFAGTSHRTVELPPSSGDPQAR